MVVWYRVFPGDGFEFAEAELGPCPGRGYTVDRIDNNRGYDHNLLGDHGRTSGHTP
jgi:hypothetical protein